MTWSPSASPRRSASLGGDGHSRRRGQRGQSRGAGHAHPGVVEPADGDEAQAGALRRRRRKAGRLGRGDFPAQGGRRGAGRRGAATGSRWRPRPPPPPGRPPAGARRRRSRRSTAPRPGPPTGAGSASAAGLIRWAGRSRSGASRLPDRHHDAVDGPAQQGGVGAPVGGGQARRSRRSPRRRPPGRSRTPRRTASSAATRQSSMAVPGGATLRARRSRRPSRLVVVPRFSPKTATGSTTSARSRAGRRVRRRRPRRSRTCLQGPAGQVARRGSRTRGRPRAGRGPRYGRRPPLAGCPRRRGRGPPGHRPRPIRTRTGRRRGRPARAGRRGRDRRRGRRGRCPGAERTGSARRAGGPGRRRPPPSGRPARPGWADPGPRRPCSGAPPDRRSPASRWAAESRRRSPLPVPVATASTRRWARTADLAGAGRSETRAWRVRPVGAGRQLDQGNAEVDHRPAQPQEGDGKLLPQVGRQQHDGPGRVAVGQAWPGEGRRRARRAARRPAGSRRCRCAGRPWPGGPRRRRPRWCPGRRPGRPPIPDRPRPAPGRSPAAAASRALGPGRLDQLRRRRP